MIPDRLRSDEKFVSRGVSHWTACRWKHRSSRGRLDDAHPLENDVGMLVIQLTTGDGRLCSWSVYTIYFSFHTQASPKVFEDP